MKTRALTAKDLSDYVEILDKTLKGRYLSSPIMYAKDTFLFHISGKGKSTLVICLNGEFPRLYLTDTEFSGSSFDDKFLVSLKKEISNAYIEGVSQINGDRVLKFDIKTINSVFKEEEKYIYLELLPHHPNLIIANEDNTIISSYKVSSLESKRPMMRGLKYLPLENNFTNQNESEFNLKEYEEICEEQEIKIFKKRKDEKFGFAISHFTNRKKLLERKINYLEKDKKEAETHLNDNLKGDAIYICYSSINNKQGSFEYEGLEISLDPARTLAQNAERYYKRSKKAKETINNADKFLKESKKELENINDILLQIDVANENSLETYANLLKIPDGKTKKKEDKISCVLSSESIPYFVTYNDTKILFGKNAKQNTFLTFMYDTSKEHLWFHIAGRSGSHVIIKKDDPNDDEIRIASEICLINSSQNDGDINYTKRKNVKKGHVLGEAILKEYKTIHLKDISEETIELLESAKRVKLHQ